MKDAKIKWVYTFFLLIITILWAMFCVWTVKKAMSNPTPVSVLEVAGVGPLLGALITWCGDVKQFWFRKQPSNTPDTSPVDPSATITTTTGPPTPPHGIT